MNKIRLLKPSDIPHLLDLSTQAGWNQTAADWERTLQLGADSCFGIEEGGRVISSTTAVRYAAELAWIGMVLTASEHRGKGHARALLAHTLKHLRGVPVRWIKLDATEQARPIYARLGFTEECAVERWKRAGGRTMPGDRAPERVHPYVVDPSFDRAYFGAYRVPLLNALAKEAAAMITGYGYAMGRPGTRAAYFGPCVVRTREAARQLLEWFLARHPGRDVYWDLLADNKDAVQLAIDHGFEPDRHLTRMVAAGGAGAPPLLRNEGSVFAIAGFEYG